MGKNQFSIEIFICKFQNLKLSSIEKTSHFLCDNSGVGTGDRGTFPPPPETEEIL